MISLRGLNSRTVAVARLAAVAITALVLSLSLATASEDRLSETARRAALAVVTIEVLVPEQAHVEMGVATNVLRATNGSGFFVDQQGHIVTNAHVVGAAVEIAVILGDGSRRPAVIVGVDWSADVAVIRVDGAVPSALSYAADVPEVGDPVIAIGSPFNLHASVSMGVVSGLHRSLRPSSPDWFLQHTALINPGSSGGPVLNERGEVLGVNTAVPDGQFEFGGIALAIEAPIVARIVQGLIDGDRLVGASVGALFRALDMTLLTALGRTDPAGVLVERVMAGEPAARGGLRADDLVLTINGEAVDSLSGLVRYLALASPDVPLVFGVERGGELLLISVAPVPTEASGEVVAFERSPIGLVFEGTGVGVAAVVPGSLAEAAGILAGDSILSINRIPVASSAAANALLESAGMLVAVRVARGDGTERVIVLGAELARSGRFGGNNIGTLSAWL